MIDRKRSLRRHHGLTSLRGGHVDWVNIAGGVPGYGDTFLEWSLVNAQLYFKLADISIHFTLAGTFIHHTLADTYNYYTRADTNVYIFYFLDQRGIFRVDRDIVFLPGRVIHGSRWSVGRSFRHVVWSLVSPVWEVRVGGSAFI